MTEPVPAPASTPVPPPASTPLAGSSLTTLIGGCGFVLALLYPLAGSLTSAFPSFVGLLLPLAGLQLAFWAVFAVACGILAFGMPGETGIVGPSLIGRTALFVFGAHRLVLDLASLLDPVPVLATDSTGPDLPAALFGGYVSLGVSLLGAAAGVVAGVCVLRAGVLLGPARWLLLPAAVVQALVFALLLVPVQEVVLLVLPVNGLGFLLLVATGVAYALHGRAPALRRRLRQLDAWW